MFDLAFGATLNTSLCWGNARALNLAPSKNAVVFGLTKHFIHRFAFKTSILTIALIVDSGNDQTNNGAHYRNDTGLQKLVKFTALVLSLGMTPLIAETASIIRARYVATQLGYPLETKNIVHLVAAQYIESLIIYSLSKKS